jgi:hypothetical protein
LFEELGHRSGKVSEGNTKIPRAGREANPLTLESACSPLLPPWAPQES